MNMLRLKMKKKYSTPDQYSITIPAVNATKREVF